MRVIGNPGFLGGDMDPAGLLAAAAAKGGVEGEKNKNQNDD